MNILIRSNSSSKIGLGHLMRDLVFAKTYKNAKVIFACEDLEGNFNHKVLEENYILELLESNDYKEVLKLLDKYKIDLLVLDSYEIDYSYEKNIKKNSSVKLLVFDDMYEKHFCDVLFNCSISANKNRYKNLVHSTCELKLGMKYQLLRDEFLEIKKRQRVLKKKQRVFLSMGGADSSNILIKISKLLKEFENIEVITLSTSANKNLPSLKKFANKNKFVKLYINSNKVAQLLDSCDFAIVPPSVSLSEIISLDMPFICIKTAKNQSDIARFLKANRFLVLEEFNKNKLKRKIKFLQKEYNKIYKKVKRLNKC